MIVASAPVLQNLNNASFLLQIGQNALTLTHGTAYLMVNG